MRLTALVLSAALLAPLAANADDDYMPPVTDQLVKNECGECHMVFQPGFLTAASWRKIMMTLADHFGEDASVDDEIRDKIQSYLVANAGRSYDNSADPPLQISQLSWFRDEHSESEVRWMFLRRKLKTMADCVPCHRDAGRGYYDD